MSVVFCAECNHVVSSYASGCRHCGAPISKADFRPPEEPPARKSSFGTAVVGVATTVAAIALVVNLGKVKPATYFPSQGGLAVPQASELASGRILIPGCRHDWRACSDNHDWIRKTDLSGPQGSCLAVVGAAAGYGDIALDHSWNRQRFTSYIPGTSIRRGYVVLVDRAGLTRDASGAWVRTPLHCTVDVGSGQALSVAPP